ncbi:3-oxoacyl-[acyl-carrier-protein] reductase [Filifactor alocis]|uniref:3-oxoacyl-[acyl-carrier-protein] reductase n=1 Tax=Filifactor alocis TaxID=143361 RepID=UPI0028D59E4E|nr:3-oxoacyl-[acyl-carrier-protein] reductase [Filifactor alocis]
MEKRVALVTGAGGGIGRAIAMQLAKSDMDIAIHYNSNRTKAEETQKLCEEFGAKVHLIQGDISTEETCKEVVEEVIKEFGTIDVLINNAGITKDGLFIRMKEEDFNQVIDTNLKGAFFMSKYAAQVMLKKRYGRIVNITSVVGIAGNAGQANYSASKAGMIGLTKSLAKELGKKGILVNAVAPGFVDTEMTDKLSDKVKESILNQIVVGCMATPEDIARTVEFLSVEENRYITGQVISVDGGMSM